MALDWLIGLIQRESVDLLIVAGDIFDTSNPPNYARRQYYDFLGKLRQTTCRHVLIIGGNHDSPAMLNATAEVLRYIDIVVVGSSTQEIENQVIEFKDAAGALEAVVAAVPFLRDRDIHYNQAGEDESTRTARLRAAIRKHYEVLGELVAPYQKKAVPILTTGHLYAHGAEASEKRSKIYIGNRSNIAATDFPAVFDYVALGHIHRAQVVGGIDHVRYSGSLISLDFSETADTKVVYLLDFNATIADGVKVAKKNAEEPGNYQLSTVEVPVFRRLKRLAGKLEKVEASLEQFLAKRSLDNSAESLPPWIEVKVESEGPLPQLHEQLQALIGERPAELLSTQVIRTGSGKKIDLQALPKLDDLSPEDVFERLCSGNNGELPDGYPALLASFRELENWRQEREDV